MSALAFLDANILAKPFTRTLLWVGALHSEFDVTWSAGVEVEAERHLPSRAMSIAELRARYGLELSATGVGADAFVETKATDRQVLADAVAAGARFLVTEDVDDFGEGDLLDAAVTAIHPDRFLAMRLSDDGYLESLVALSAGMANPRRTAAEVHTAAGRLHPQLVTAKLHLFPGVQPAQSTHAATAVQQRPA